MLCSNLAFWLQEFNLDGFRFANVTNSLYLNHGVGLSSNLPLTEYFSDNANFKGLAYFMLANEIIHQIHPDAISIAEEFTGFPTLCFSVNDGGLGFDYYQNNQISELVKIYRIYFKVSNIYSRRWGSKLQDKQILSGSEQQKL